LKLLRHLLAIGLLPFVVTVVIPAYMIRASSTLNTGWDLPSPLSLLPPLLGCALLGLGVLLVYKTVILFATVGEGTLAPWDPPPEARGPGTLPSRAQPHDQRGTVHPVGRSDPLRIRVLACLVCEFSSRSTRSPCR